MKRKTGTMRRRIHRWPIFLVLLWVAEPGVGRCQTSNQIGAIWAVQGGGTADQVAHGGDYGNLMVRDAEGNLIIAGTFSYSAAFGDIHISSGEAFNGFVARYDRAGTPLWVHSFPRQAVLDMAADSTGHIYVLRTGYSTVLHQYDLDGTLLWTQTLVNNHSTGAVGVDAEHNIWVCTQDGVMPGGSVVSVGLLFAKYRPDGSLLWRNIFPAVTSRGIGVYRMVIGETGDCYVAGNLGDSWIDFGGMALSSATSDFFLAKVTSDGLVDWAVQMATSAEWPAFRYVRGLARDSSGHLIFCGAFNGTATFGQSTLNSVDPSNPNVECAFIAKCDGAGSLMWAKAEFSSVSSEGEALALDSAGNSHYIVTSVAGQDGGRYIHSAEVLKLDPEGSVLGRWPLGDGAFTYSPGYGLVLGADGDLVVSGAFRGQAIFGSIQLTSVGDSDLFVARLSEPAPDAPELSFGAGGGNLFLSWNTNATGFVLESTPSLTAPNWQPTSETPVSTNDQWLVTVPADDSGARYFRLSKP